MAQYDIINPQTGAVVGSTQDPTAATSQGFQVRLRDGTQQQQGNQQQGQMNTQQVLEAYSRGAINENEAIDLLTQPQIGFTRATAQSRIAGITTGSDPQFPAPQGTQQPTGTQQPGQTQQPTGTQPGTQGTGGAVPTATQFQTGMWLGEDDEGVPDADERLDEPPSAVLEIFNQLRNGQINTDTAITRLMPWMRNGTPESAMRLLQERVLGAAGDGGNTLAEQFGTGLGGPDLMQQRGLGDVSRAFAIQSGVAPAFRDLVQQQAARQEQFAFPLQVALGAAPGSSGLAFQDAINNPEVFEQFLSQGQVPSGIGQSLRQAGDLLRNPSQGVLGGAEAIRNLLTGPSGSVGSELFAPTVNLALQDAGRRFAPGLGQAARSGTASALENMFAQDPTRFQTAPDFIDFLARQRVI